MGKSRLIAETGAGQHGVATATAAALFGLECVVYMGEVDTQRQALNVFRMELLGAEVRPVRSGSRTLKDAVNEALRDWVATRRRHPLLPRLGDGPAPVPVHGARVPAGRRRRGPRAVPASCSAVATPTSSSPASAAARTPRARSPASSTPRRGSSASRRPAARRSAAASRASCTACGRSSSRTRTARSSRPTRSRPGSTTPASGPSTPTWRRSAGPSYEQADDDEVLGPSSCSPATEGIIPALESAHALAWVVREAGRARCRPGSTVLVTLSGRGDKDVAQVRDRLRRLTASGASRARRSPGGAATAGASCSSPT